MEIDLTTSYVGILSLIVFVLVYAIVMAEEFNLRKSKPVIISVLLFGQSLLIIFMAIRNTVMR